jgi:hypothetical protein
MSSYERRRGQRARELARKREQLRRHAQPIVSLPPRSTIHFNVRGCIQPSSPNSRSCLTAKAAGSDAAALEGVLRKRAPKRTTTAGCQLISTLSQSAQKALVSIRNEAWIIGESLPHPFRQPGFKVPPFPSEPIVSAPMHIAWALGKRT